MIRQRIGLRTPGLALIVRALTVLLALALFWYGLMVVLLAVKVSPHTVNELSGYRTLYHDVSTLREGDFTTVRRLVAGVAGVLLFAALVYLALQLLPRPHLTRHEVKLPDESRGVTSVEPRAIERLAETAAVGVAGVSAASGRLGDGELNLSVTVRRAAQVADDLQSARRRVREAVTEHELPELPVNVTLTGYERPKRELA